MRVDGLARNILNVTIARLGYPCVGHGFRSTFRDWCGDHGVQREIAEAALGHVVPGVEGDYRRRDALALRRHLMQQCAKFIEQPWGEHSHMSSGSARARRDVPAGPRHRLASARASWLTASWCFSFLISAKLRATSSSMRWCGVICRGPSCSMPS